MVTETDKRRIDSAFNILGQSLAPPALFGILWLAGKVLFTLVPPQSDWGGPVFWASLGTMVALLLKATTGGRLSIGSSAGPPPRQQTFITAHLLWIRVSVTEKNCKPKALSLKFQPKPGEN